jgi:hypothetical protein
MTIKIELTCADAAEARALLAALAETAEAPTPAEAPAPAAQLELAMSAPEPTAPAVPAPAAPAPAAPEPAAPAPTLDAAIGQLREFGRTRGAIAIRGVLDQLGVRRASELQPEQAGALIAAMNGAAG